MGQIDRLGWGLFQLTIIVMIVRSRHGFLAALLLLDQSLRLLAIIILEAGKVQRMCHRFN
jgi:hypothetical protein